MAYQKGILTVIGATAALLFCAAGAHVAQASGDDHAQMTDVQLVEAAGAPLFEGMGSYNRTINTSHPGAQRYFNQGMVMSFGFNHAEAIRSFRAAQRLDPTCAMCFWGEALATGPNINIRFDGQVVMQPQERLDAFAAVNKAMALREVCQLGRAEC